MGSSFRPVGLGGNQGITGTLRLDEIATLNGDATALTVGGAMTVSGAVTLSSTIAMVAGSLARAALAAETVFIDLEDKLMTATGTYLAAAEAAGTFNHAIGTNQWFINGEVTVNETEVSVGWFTFVLPENYVAGAAISLRAIAGVTVAGDAVLNVASTIDMEARLQTDATGAVGSDLVTTAATAIVAAGATYDFVLTVTGLVAGDKLICKLTTSIVEDAAGTGAATAFINKLGAVISVKG